MQRGAHHGVVMVNSDNYFFICSFSSMQGAIRINHLYRQVFRRSSNITPFGIVSMLAEYENGHRQRTIRAERD